MPEDPLVGRLIAGKYRLDAAVGAGSMGTVYRATQIALHKSIAIKVMNQDFAREKTYASRFKREAKAASRLDHPNSLRVIDFGDDEGLLYIAMEFLDGRDLLQIVRDDWPLSTDRIVNLLSQTLAALAVAHDMGIVHRDLKPENVMVLRSKDDEGRASEVVKVCDFGVAKFLDVKRAGGDDTQNQTATGTLTAAGMLVGTPEYMSPEQVSGEELDGRSDLYSLGVILFQLLTRRLPFEAKSAIKLALKHIEETPRAPSKLVPGIDPRLEIICLKALRKNKDERQANAREMRMELRAVVGAPPDAASLSMREAPRVSSRFIPHGKTVSSEDAALSKAATLVQSQPPPALAASRRIAAPPVTGPTTTEPSAAQLLALKRRRWIAAATIVVAVLLLLLFGR